MRSNLVLAALVVAVATTACSKRDPVPSAQESRSAPLAAGPRGAGRGFGGRAGAGAGAGPGAGPHMACPPGSEPLGEAARVAIGRALADEREAEARYDAVVRQLGPVMPFRQLERAERRHAAALEQLLVAHGAPVPAARSPMSTAPVTSLREACVQALETETRNIALYDELSSGDLPADVRCVFSHLRAASSDRHRPALERCDGAR